MIVALVLPLPQITGGGNYANKNGYYPNHDGLPNYR